MNNKQFFLIFVLTGGALSKSPAINFGGLRDSLQTGSYYAEELTKGLISGNILQSAQNILGLVSQIHPIAGAVAGAVFFCLSIFGATQQTENPLLVAIREGVGVICRKLDGISDAIRDLEFAIKFEIRGLSLDHQVDDIEGLLSLQQQLIGKGDNESLENFVNSCLLSRMYEKPFWFSKVLTARNPNNLKYLIIGERDATQLNGYYQRVISLFFQSVILDSSCTAARFKGKDNETVQFYLDRKGDNAEFLLKQIYESMKVDSEEITRDFFLYALGDVVKIAKKYADQDKELAFDDLKETLNRKYNYREWLIIVYGNKDTHGVSKHVISPDMDNQLIHDQNKNGEGYFRNFIRFHGTNYVIGTPTAPVDKKWSDAVFECAVPKDYIGRLCDYLEKVVKCLEDNRIYYFVAGCVYEKHYLSSGDGNMFVIEFGYMVIFVLK